MVDIVRYQVLLYRTQDGKCPAGSFLNTLPIKVQAKISKWFEQLERYGPDLPRPYADIIRGKIRELRIIFASQQYRFLYFFHNRHIIITHGFIKKTDKVPEAEVERAQKLMVDFEFRVNKGEENYETL